jgi:predicted PurR-regulated permease PerM
MATIFPSQRLSIDITTGTIFRILLILLAVWFFSLIIDILLMLLAAIILAGAIEPVVNWLQRYRVPRAISVVVVYVCIIVVIVGVLSLLIQPLTEQTIQLANSIPALTVKAHTLIPIIPALDDTMWQQSVQASVNNFGHDLANLSLSVFQQTKTVFAAFFSIVFVFVLALYLMVEEDALKKFARIITPRVHLPYVEQVLERVQVSIGRWVLAQLALGVIMGTIVGLVLWIMGVKYALLLGLLSGILEILPVIGPIVAAVPGVIIGISQSLPLGIGVLLVYIISQQIENHVLVPNIMRRAIGLNPLVTIIAVLLGVRLAGLSGAILSVPVATILSVILSDIFAQPSVEDELPG